MDRSVYNQSTTGWILRECQPVLKINNMKKMFFFYAIILLISCNEQEANYFYANPIVSAKNELVSYQHQRFNNKADFLQFQKQLELFNNKDTAYDILQKGLQVAKDTASVNLIFPLYDKRTNLDLALFINASVDTKNGKIIAGKTFIAGKDYPSKSIDFSANMQLLTDSAEWIYSIAGTATLNWSFNEQPMEQESDSLKYDFPFKLIPADTLLSDKASKIHYSSIPTSFLIATSSTHLLAFEYRLNITKRVASLNVKMDGQPLYKKELGF